MLVERYKTIASSTNHDTIVKIIDDFVSLNGDNTNMNPFNSPIISNYTFLRLKGTLNTQNWILFKDTDIKERYQLFEELATFIETKISEVQKIEECASKTAIKKQRKKAIPATLKRLVWNKAIGEDVGKAKCKCCGVTDITQLAFNCGHIISEKNGGSLTVDNLLPICQNCNSCMGTMNMDTFKDTFKI